MTIRIVPADKADMLMVTDNGLEAAEHMEEEPTVVDEELIRASYKKELNILRF